ncbi:hypothetical protein C8R43DRAFT_984774 [Mycena crocata]|nr:hypothetical protein C8R43DRAFT_984774 [Mycena crocata]
MTSERPARYAWAVISPSAKHSVAYMRSFHATSAAQDVVCGRYLALVKESEPSVESQYTPGHVDPWNAYLVHSATRYPRPAHYLPIAPCRMGSRAYFEPGLEWPFEECVVNMEGFSFDPVVETAGDTSPHYLADDEARHVAAICECDMDDAMEEELATRDARRRAEQAADGFSGDDGSIWTTFSDKSTRVRPLPGQFFPPITISVNLSYDIESLQEILPATKFLHDTQEILRLRTRFSRPSTERTINWTLEQASLPKSYPPVAEDFSAPLNALLVDFSCELSRPSSPARGSSPTASGNALEQYDMCDFDSLSINGMFAPFPVFKGLENLQVMYFDVYGTLIDNESGIFDGLQSLLSRSPRRFERQEALTFYFESEVAVKQRAPSKVYSQILHKAYEDMALRLGLSPPTGGAATFAHSLPHWPLHADALWALHTLRCVVPTLAALVDMDHSTCVRTPAFTALALYFDEVFTWDATHSYRPARDAFTAPLGYHDALGVPRACRALVSNSLLRDVQPSRELGFPAIWLRLPGSLAWNAPPDEGTAPGCVYDTFRDLVSEMWFSKHADPE